MKRFFGKISYKNRVIYILDDINSGLRKRARSKGIVPEGCKISVLRGLFKLVDDYVDPSIAAYQQEIERYHKPHMMPNGDYLIPSSGQIISRSEGLRRGY